MIDFKLLLTTLSKLDSNHTCPGIYMLYCLKNDTPYIGSTNNLYRRRKEHTKKLNARNHHTIRLQNAWNKYGKSAFIYYVLETIEPEKATSLHLLERENFYLLQNPKDTYFNSEIPAIDSFHKSSAGKPKAVVIISDEQKYSISKTLYNRPIGHKTMEQKMKIGRANALKRGFTPITIESAEEIKKLDKILTGFRTVEDKRKEIARQFNTSEATIGCVVSGRHWTNPEFKGYRHPQPEPIFMKMEKDGFKMEENLDHIEKSSTNILE